MSLVPLKRVGVLVSAAFLMSTFAVVRSARPSWACSCSGGGSDEGSFEHADVVFIGTADHAVSIPGTNIQADPWTFTVESIQKGPRKTSFEIRTGIQLTRLHRGKIGVARSSCAIPFVRGRRYQIFGMESRRGAVDVGTCSATRELAAPGAQSDLSRAQMKPYIPGAGGPGAPIAAGAALIALGLAFTLRRREGTN